MQLNFQQGIVTYPIKNGRQTFLIRNGQYVSLQTLDGDTTITFAHGHNNYLYTESVDVTNAWGPLTTGTEYWLYWDINTLTGIRTFGFTSVQPMFSIVDLKPVGVLDLHWFDTTNKKMFVYQADGWREVIRVFAAKVTDTSFFPIADNSRTQPFVGTQVGLKGYSITADYIRFDSTNLPVRRVDGLLYTEQKTAIGTSNPITPIRYESNILLGQAATAVQPFQITKINTSGNLVPASYNDIQDTILNVALAGGTGNIALCQQGLITNPDWTFTDIGALLWINNVGELTTTDPNVTDPITYPIAKVPVARVVSPTSIFFDVGMGGTGSDGNFGEGPSFSSTTEYGIGRLSLPATNPLQPIVAGTNDPRLVAYVHPLTHPSSIITTDAFGILTGANLNIQLQELADRTLDSLSDISAATPSVGQGLQWNGSSWISASYPSVQLLDDIADVTLSSPISGQILGFSGLNWENTTRNLALSADVTGSGTQNVSGVIDISTTLATVNSNVGTFGNDTNVGAFTVNAKGLVTAAQNIPIDTGGGPIIPPSVTLWSVGDDANGTLGTLPIADRSSLVQVNSFTDWIKIAGGRKHSLAIRDNGTLWIWGIGDTGQLGNGMYGPFANFVSTPTQLGVLTNWAQVSSGLGFTAAVKTDGTLWTWGENSRGQLGNNSIVDTSSPIQIGTSTDWSQVTCGYVDTTAIKTDGTLWAWGNNTNGALGDGTIVHRSSPIQIGTMTNWSSIARGNDHTAAIKTDGTLWTWGNNTSGQLGNNTTIKMSSPIQIGSSTNWSQVACGQTHSIAVKTDGTLWSWGLNSFGQLGLGDTTNRSSPTQVGTLTNWQQVDGGQYHTVAVKTDGTAWACGYNFDGQLGVGDNITRSSPVQMGSLNTWTYALGTYRQTHLLNTVSGSGGVTSVDASGGTTGFTFTGGPVTLGAGVLTMDGTLNISNGGTSATIANDAFNNLAPSQTGFQGSTDTNVAWVCGYGLYAGTNSGGNNKLSSPIQVSDTSWTSLACGYDHNAAIKPDGTLWTWGFNFRGQLGHGTLFKTQVPSQVGALTNWTIVSCGFQSTIAIKQDGTLWSWGINSNGELGLGNTQHKSSPMQIGALTDWSYVSAGSSIVGAVKTNGTLWTWGNNAVGQLGDGTIVSKSSPIQIGVLSDWSTIACSYNETVALKTDGTLWGWGRNQYGQLVDGTVNPKSSPIQIGLLNDWAEVSCGYNHIGARKIDGTVWVWGGNTYGQLGTGTVTNISSPVQISAATDWIRVRCSNYTTYAMKSDGTIWGWGRNSAGQLGDGTLVNKSSPIQIGSYSDWTAIASNLAGTSFGGLRTINYPGGYFLKTDGSNTSWDPVISPGYQSLFAWGSNGGKFGNGTISSSSSPILVESTTSWKQLSTSTSHVAGLRYDNTLWTWGGNGSGQLGDGTVVSKSSPVQIISNIDWKFVSCGISTTAAIKSDGTLWVWGANPNGELGLGDRTNRSSPTQVGSLTDWNKISAGYLNMVATKVDGTLWTWGNNVGGRLGIIDTVHRSSPTQIGALTDWKEVSSSDFAAAIKTDGTLWMWGRDSHGQLGTGVVAQVSSPVQIGALTDWKQVSCGYQHTHAIRTNGTLWAWGNNDFGNLGLNDVVHRSSPTQVGSLITWDLLGIGVIRGHTTAIKTDGTLWIWGTNSSGALGLGDLVNRSSPVQVGSLNNWSSVVNTQGITTALTIDGNILSINQGGTGKIFASDSINALLPSQEGQYHKALTFDGTTISWLTASGT